MGGRTAAATLGMLLCSSVLAQADTDARFPGAAVDDRTLATQQKVEELYSAGEYGRALLIYERELAPIGDKYAQYMTGYMHLNGQGVARSAPEALAWYRLAAERGEPALEQARDALERSLGPGERAASDEIYQRLRARYSDRKLLLELIADDLDILRERTGSRLPGPDTNATFITGQLGGAGSEGFYRSVRDRLERRLQYLDSLDRGDQSAPAEKDPALDALESRVRRELRSLDAAR